MNCCSTVGARPWWTSASKNQSCARGAELPSLPPDSEPKSTNSREWSETFPENQLQLQNKLPWTTLLISELTCGNHCLKRTQGKPTPNTK